MRHKTTTPQFREGSTLEQGSGQLYFPKSIVVKSEKKANAGTAKRRSKRKGRDRYLKITCPMQGCGRALVLICPYCHEGALSCHGRGSILQCDRCRNTLKGVTCGCGFTLTSSYVERKHHTLERYHNAVDVAGYKVIGYTIGCGALILFLSGLFQ